jgi:diadenylate cyclase
MGGAFGFNIAREIIEEHRLSSPMLEQVTSLLKPLTPEIVQSTLDLAIEIAREGREGRRIGTLFTLGSADAVLELSRPLILDPLAGHPEAARHITDPSFRGTVKELAQLDGAFVITEAGVFVAACRYLDARAMGLTLPQGLGARHMAAAAISKATTAVGIVVSQTATVRVFKAGKLEAEVLPELWLLGRYTSYLPAPIRADQVSNMAVLVRQEK